VRPGGRRGVVAGEVQRSDRTLELRKGFCPFGTEQSEAVLPRLGVYAEDPAAKLGCHRVHILHPLRDPLLVVGEPRQVAGGIPVAGELDDVLAGGLVSTARDRVDDGVEGMPTVTMKAQSLNSGSPLMSATIFSVVLPGLATLPSADFFHSGRLLARSGTTGAGTARTTCFALSFSSPSSPATATS
jgi:hypothetical protein